MERSRQRFLWQTGLVVLPMLGLAAFALWSLRHDQARVETRYREEAERWLSQMRFVLMTEWIGLCEDMAVSGDFAPIVFQGDRLIAPVPYDVPPRPYTPEASPELQATAQDLLVRAENGSIGAKTLIHYLDLPAGEWRAWLLYECAQRLRQRHGLASVDSLLEYLLEAEDNGWSSSGLPIMPLAEAQLLEEAERARDQSQAARLARRLRKRALEQPSILTTSFLNRTRKWAEDDPDREQRQWERSERARLLAAELSDDLLERPYLVISWQEGPVWLDVTREDDQSKVQALREEDVREFVARFQPQLDGHGSPLRMQVASFGSWETSPKRVIAIGSAGPFRLQVVLQQPGLIQDELRGRQWTTAGMVLGALTLAGLGLWSNERSLRRERHLHQLKSNFVSSVSHELRTPIASVSLMADSLQRGRVPEGSRRDHYYQLIGQECRRLGMLIENVLDVSCIEQGRKQYEFEETNMAQLGQDTIDLMMPMAKERGVALWWHMKDGAEDLQPSVDAGALRQCLINLIDNAIKNSIKDMIVSVVMKTDPEQSGWFQIMVTDQGAGISKAEQVRIFDPFYRVGSELTRSTTGSGIGLHIVRHVVEAHGGRIELLSSQGQGSSFTLHLPLHHD